MSWVGLWDSAGGSYSPAGFGTRSRGVVDINALLARGSLMIDCALTGAASEETILDYAAAAPWPARLKITADQAGVITLTHVSGDVAVQQSLATGHIGQARQVTVLYTWDAPARVGALSVEIGDTGAHVFKTFAEPMPLSLRDAVRLVADPRRCRKSAGVRFAALADHVVPLGPLPTLAGQTQIATPDGLVPLSTLKAGHLVTLADGSQAQVRWVGAMDLPARGRFAPLKLHAPFYRAVRDLICAPDQKLQLSGTDVDYLFATPTVACDVGHLIEGVHPLRPPPGKVMRYWQLVLDRPAPLRIGGLDVETLDVARILRTPGLLRHSVLADVPGELLPKAGDMEVPVLRGYETQTLCRLRVA